MSLMILKRAGLLSLFFVLSVGGLWINRQQNQLIIQQENNTRLSQQVDILQAHLDEITAREARLSVALTARQKTLTELEDNHEQYRLRLRHTVAQAPCAAQPVPDAVIRLQRDALHGHGAAR